MHHFTRTPTGSAIDVAIAMSIGSRPPAPSRSGITEIRATLAATGPDNIEHVWFRTDTETERDFTSQALAAARALGLAAVEFAGIAAVPPAEEDPR
jgi:hypothetical protein